MSKLKAEIASAQEAAEVFRGWIYAALNKASRDEATPVDLKVVESYQRFYITAAEVIEVCIPQRSDDFKRLYAGECRSKLTWDNYCIQDFLNGNAPYSNSRCRAFEAVINRFGQQLAIFNEGSRRLNEGVQTLRETIRLDLFDDELDAAHLLLKEGLLRPAGALAGVVLERHLVALIEKHSIAVRKTKPTIGDLNEALKAANAIDHVTNRRLQMLVALRNACVHQGEREPKAEDVEDLISGVTRIVRELL